MEKIIKFNGKTYYHASKYREEKNISYQQMNNLLHGKKYKKRYVKKAKENNNLSMKEKRVDSLLFVVCVKGNVECY